MTRTDETDDLPAQPKSAPLRVALRSSLRLLNRRDRRLLLASAGLQMASAVLDLIGVALLGLLAAVAASSLQGVPVPESVQTVLDSVGLSDVDTSTLVVALGIGAALALLAKSVLSALLNRRILRFLANRQALVSARLATELLSRPLSVVQTFTSQELSYALTFGASAATLQLLGQVVIALSEIALLALLGVALFVVDPWVTVAALAYFGVLLLLLQRSLGSWAADLGAVRSETLVGSLNAIQEAVSVYREISVLDRRSFYADRIRSLRWRASKAEADSQFLALVPKLVLESALVIGVALLVSTLFLTRDAVSAVSAMVLFLAAGSRVMPSLLRLQGSTLGIRGAASAAAPTYALAELLGHPVADAPAETNLELIRANMRAGHAGLVPRVSVHELSFTYPGSRSTALTGVSLELPEGSSTGIVGSSGAGKSTLADLLLGVIAPDLGVVTIGGLPAAEATSRWPGGIAYVPQEVALANGSARDNVALGLPRDAVDDSLVWDALEKSRLAEFLRDSRDGLDTEIGESGFRLSGGQRQRLGIARALYTRPKLLILDEATSSLDAETESAIAETISALGGAVTTVVIAHRLATVRSVDLVVYLERGRVVAQGSFAEVRSAAPGFDRQAKLLGL